MNFFEELKRRNVFRVGIAYVLLGWVVLQAADFALDIIDAPNWIIQALLIVGLAGLPIALFFAWAFEITPEGIKREADVDRTASVSPQTGRKLDRAIIVFLVLVVVGMGVERFYSAEKGSGNSYGAGAEKVSDPFSSSPAKSIAVLPFADLSQAGDQEWFADGLAEEILNALARTPDLLVASRTSSFSYKGTHTDILEIAQELGVAHVLEGSVRSSGDRIRVTAQLIRAEDGFHVWSENYDRSPDDMIAIQEDLARNIADALETTMDPDALAQMASVGTESVAAYQAFLQGTALSLAPAANEEVDRQNVLDAYAQFERARTLDPGFAAAHFRAAAFWETQLAPTAVNSGLSDLSASEQLAEFQLRIDQAITNAPSDIDRAAYQGARAQIDLRLGDAISLYQQYLQARPNDFFILGALLQVAILAEEEDITNRVLDQLKERGTTDRQYAQTFINEAYRHGREDEAADFGLQIVERWPTDPSLAYQVHRTLLWAGRTLEARSMAERFRRLQPGSNVILEARQACAEGDRARTESLLAGLEPNDIYDLSNRWHLNMLLGNTVAAQQSLQEFADSGVPYTLANFLIYHQFDPSPFPSLMRVLEREGINRPPPAENPFNCPPPERTSVAVLAFDNMSPDPENEYFADGISEEILNVLAGLDDLRVIARTSAFSFKGSEATVAEIAEKLDVGYVLEGSVRRAGNRVRVTAQLIDTADESHLWSDTYDRDLDDIFAVQDEIARAIAGELELQLTPDQQVALVAAPTKNLEAYNKYLQGRQLWHSRGVQNLQVSAALLEQAVTLDPDFAEAWAALADSWLLIPEYSESRSMETIPKARDAVNRALELKPGMPEALTTRAYIRFLYDFDWENAERDFKRALELDPGYATAQQWYGEFLAIRDRDVDGALAQVMKAARLDPLAPVMWNVAGFVTAWTGRYEESIGYYRRTLEIEPGFDAAYSNLAFINLQMGNFETAREMWRRGAALTDDPPDEFLRFVDAMEDPILRPAYIESIADSTYWVSGAVDRALVYMLLGDADRAMTDLEQSLEAGYPYAAHVNRMTIFDPLRDTPRFQAHLAKMNLWPPAE